MTEKGTPGGSDISINVQGGAGMDTDEKLRVVRAALNKAIAIRKPIKKAGTKPKAVKLKKPAQKKKKKPAKASAKPKKVAPSKKNKKPAASSKKTGNIIFNF